MDDDANDLDGLFEEYENGSEGNDDNNNGDTNPSNPTENAVKVAAPRRAVKNPRLKFNAERLCGERGIPVVVKHFEGVKFKGKGHEVEDLNKLLSTLEHWCHRLYPSMKFDDCLRQIEKLGKKRPVQTCLRKIRFDMPILNDDFVHEEPEEKEVEVEVPPQDAFDRLINEIQGNSDAQLASTPLPVKTAAPEHKLGSFGSTLTEEQRQRMEYNKMLATERRKAKFLAMQSSSVPSNKSENLSTVESTSAIHSSTKQVTNSMFDDIFTESRSLLSQKSDKLYSASNDSSEELELDDLVDLVNDDDEPSSIQNEDNSVNTFPKMNKQGSVKRKCIILSDESDDDEIDKNDTEVVNLENEVEKSSVPNKIIEVINLESKRDTEPILMVNLDPESSVNVSNPTHKLPEVINLENYNSEPMTSMHISNPLHVINLESEEVDLTIEKTLENINSEIDLANTLISSTGVNKGGINLLSPDKVPDSFNANEIVQDDAESMEID